MWGFGRRARARGARFPTGASEPGLCLIGFRYTLLCSRTRTGKQKSEANVDYVAFHVNLRGSNTVRGLLVHLGQSLGGLSPLRSVPNGIDGYPFTLHAVQNDVRSASYNQLA
jgi:hypothetical protein